MEKQRGIATDLPMHGQIGGDHRQSAGHRFDQRMSKGFRVRRSHIDMALSIYVMQQMVRNRSQFHDLLADTQLPYQSGNYVSTIRAGIGFCMQFASKKQLDPSAAQSFSQNW